MGSLEASMRAAAEIVDRWGSSSDEFTGRWVDVRDALVGVGIEPDGDDEAVRELLQSLVPPAVRIRVRLVSGAWVRLRQVQVHVAHFLDDERIWGSYAVALSVDQVEKHVRVGLLPATPDTVAAQILEQFPQDVALDRNASHAIAL